MNVREKLVELFYDNNVRCDQKIEGLADDAMDIIAHGVTVQVCKLEDKKTNADRIRAMNAEQLAEWALFRAPQIGREYSHSLIGLITWLQQPAEEVSE